MRIGALLSIREKSTRLPGKVLMKMHGQSVTEHLIDRLRMAREVDLLAIATSRDPRDDVFVQMGRAKGIEVFRGSEDDKLLRYLDAARAYNLDAVIIIDGDDILCFPEYVDLTAQRLRQGGCDVVFTKDLPLGAASSGLTRKALERVIELKAESDTEVWGGYFTRPGLFTIAYLEPTDAILRHPEIRMTMDYQEDFDFFKAIFDELYPKNPLFSSADMMSLLVNRRPEICSINREAQARYEAHLTKAAPVKFKEKFKE